MTVKRKNKLSKILKEKCKKLKIKLTIKRNGKRVYKSEKVLKAQCAKKKKVIKNKLSKNLKKKCKKLKIKLTIKKNDKRVYKSEKVLKEQYAKKKVVRRRKFGSSSSSSSTPKKKTVVQNPRTPLKKPGSSTINTNNFTCENFLKGTIFYHADSSRTLRWDKPTWFTLKREDLQKNYGRYIFKCTLTEPLVIMDLERKENQTKVKELMKDKPNLIRAFEEAYVDNRVTSRETDYRIVDFLNNKLNGIDGIGTGRGNPSLEDPKGHHSEICIFLNSSDKIECNLIESLDVSLNEKAVSRGLKREREMSKKDHNKRAKYLSNTNINKKLF